MKQFIKKYLKKLFNWIFEEELSKLKKETENAYQQSLIANDILKRAKQRAKDINNLLGNLDVSVDIHRYSSSWAVISLQGKTTDYLKFVNLGESQIREIAQFLSNFDRSKIDANPLETKMLREETRYFKRKLK